MKNNKTFGIDEQFTKLIKKRNMKMLLSFFISSTFTLLTVGSKFGLSIYFGSLPFLFILDWIMKETTRGRRNGV